MQTRKHSFLEAVINCFIGWLVAFTAQLVIFPMVGIFIDLNTNLEVSLYFTVVSIARSYLLRRFFNKITVKTL